MRKLIGVALVALLAGVGAWFTLKPAPAAPSVTFTGLDGQRLTTADLRGKVVLVKFWATSCVTCVRQMPDTIAYHQQYAAQGYETIAVAMAYDPPNYVLNFAESRQLPFMVAVDAQGELARAFGDIRLTPTALLIDRRGRIVKRYVGEYDKAAFIATLERELGRS